MNKRRKRWTRCLRPALVMLLAVLMCANVCIPGFTASAEEVKTEGVVTGAPVTEENVTTGEGETGSGTSVGDTTGNDPEQSILTVSEPVDEVNTEQTTVENAVQQTTTEDTTEKTTTEDVTEKTTTEDTTEVGGAQDPVVPVEGASEEGTEDAGMSEAAQAYADQINAFLTEAQNLDAESENIQTQCADIYNRMMVVYSQMGEAKAAGSITEEEYNTVDAMIGSVMDVLGDYGYNPYATMALPGPPPTTGEKETSGNFEHLEIEIAAAVKYKIDGVEYDDEVVVTTSNTYELSAYTLDANKNKVPFTDFTHDGNFTSGNGSTRGRTVNIDGSFPSGTKDDPVYYTVKIYTSLTVTLPDGTPLTIPVTLETTSNYWSSDNYCPGVKGSYSDWSQGYFVGHGMDIPITGEAIGALVTKGKLAIQKIITDDTSEFTFYVQNSEGKYLVFSNNECTGLSDTLVAGCIVTVKGGSSLVLTKVPVGTYTVTEQMKDGYIITDAEGNQSSTYTVDYSVQNQPDNNIPVAQFYNKKLVNEAGISIKKIASGLTSAYPNPAVSIYATDAEGNKTGEAVWSGTLIANGDTYYLKATLSAGTYIIEESGQEKEGYNCTTTISGGESINGMKFTVSAGKRYDMIVSNIYTPKTYLTITKDFSGMEEGAEKPAATFKIYSADDTEFANVIKEITLDGTAGWTAEINDLPAGNYVVIETVPSDVSGYNYVSTSFTVDNGSVTEGVKTDSVTVNTTDRKVVAYTNVYERSNTSITVTKTISGNMISKNDAFTFVVEVKVPDAEGNLVAHTFTDAEVETMTGMGCEVEGNKVTFSLKDGDVMEFTELIPIGATVTVTEQLSDATAKYEVYINDPEKKKQDEDHAYIVTNIQKPEQVDFYNHFDATIETGIIHNSFPMYLLISAVIVFAGILLADKRRYGNF